MSHPRSNDVSSERSPITPTANTTPHYLTSDRYASTFFVDKTHINFPHDDPDRGDEAASDDVDDDDLLPDMGEEEFDLCCGQPLLPERYTTADARKEHHHLLEGEVQDTSTFLKLAVHFGCVLSQLCFAGVHSSRLCHRLHGCGLDLGVLHPT
eukprot:TRINITY_DN4367_c0_g1_i2.p1 TRINITY_DN4367_c0_g1~~TRINITY_DN4367_c0_g1_i2.p1  ORF type:complete len:153 (+),score=28.98 TRINITY_DN4367_c0_g1_i2:135-593(+)